MLEYRDAGHTEILFVGDCRSPRLSHRVPPLGSPKMEQGQQSGGPLARGVQAVLPASSQMGPRTWKLPPLTCDPGCSFVTQFPLFSKGHNTAWDAPISTKGLLPGWRPPPPSTPVSPLPAAPPAPPELLQSRAWSTGPSVLNVLQFRPRPQARGLQSSRMRVAAVQGTPNTPPPTKMCPPLTPTLTEENIAFSGPHLWRERPWRV